MSKTIVKKQVNLNRIRDVVEEVNKKLPESKRFTQRKIAELMGVETITVSSWYQGRRDPNLKDLKRLADILKVDICDLINR